MLGLAIIIKGISLILSDKFIEGGNGIAGLAASSSAVEAQATALVATSVIVTWILVPIFTSICHNRVTRVQAIG